MNVPRTFCEALYASYGLWDFGDDRLSVVYHPGPDRVCMLRLHDGPGQVEHLVRYYPCGLSFGFTMDVSPDRLRAFAAASEGSGTMRVIVNADEVFSLMWIPDGGHNGEFILNFVVKSMGTLQPFCTLYKAAKAAFR